MKREPTRSLRERMDALIDRLAEAALADAHDEECPGATEALPSEIDEDSLDDTRPQVPGA